MFEIDWKHKSNLHSESFLASFAVIPEQNGAVADPEKAFQSKTSIQGEIHCLFYTSLLPPLCLHNTFVLFTAFVCIEERFGWGILTLSASVMDVNEEFKFKVFANSLDPNQSSGLIWIQAV